MNPAPAIPPMHWMAMYARPAKKDLCYLPNIRRDCIKFSTSPLRTDMLLISIRLTVTAGFMRIPPNSCKLHEVAMTTQPMPKATCTGDPALLVFHVKGNAHWTETRRNVAMNSAMRSRHQPLERSSLNDAILLHESEHEHAAQSLVMEV